MRLYSVGGVSTLEASRGITSAPKKAVPRVACCMSRGEPGAYPITLPRHGSPPPMEDRSEHRDAGVDAPSHVRGTAGPVPAHLGLRRRPRGTPVLLEPGGGVRVLRPAAL